VRKRTTIIALFLSGLFLSSPVQAADTSKYLVGGPCSLTGNIDKPANFYCFSETKVVKVGNFLNRSGNDIPAGFPVSIASQEDKTLIRVTNIKLDKKIVGISKSTILNGTYGEVWIGDGDPNCCDYADFNEGRPGQIISNFDTSMFKKDQTLYVGSDGHITNVKPSKVVTVGKVSWVGVAEPDSYTLDIGQVPKLQVSTWQVYSPEGSQCGTLTEQQISPELVCVLDNDSNYVLKSKFPKQNIGDFLHEKTGFAPDATSWLLIVSVLFLIGLIVNTVWTRGESKSKNATSALLGVIVVGLGIFGAVIVTVNIIEPFFRGNPVDFSKKINGIPQYFFLLPTMLAIVLRNNSKK
jgi:hypothetical protein